MQFWLKWSKPRLSLKIFSFALFLVASTASAQNVGGVQADGNYPVNPNRTENLANGLSTFFRNYGKLRVSADAAGSNDKFHVVKIAKPTADATVHKAYLLAASLGGVTINDGDITLDGKPVTWFDSVYNSLGNNTNFFHNVVGDVTGIVRTRLNAASPGKVSFALEELQNNVNIDGEILVVVFHVPSLTKAERRTVALLFGGQKLTGDRFQITIDTPIDPTDINAHAQLGLGISYGCQSSSACAFPIQYSTIDVNGIRMSTSAGGQDDGAIANGALITLGGRGDSRKIPADPVATPTDTRDDDEYYNLLSFLDSTSTSITVDTFNPSNDDNILFAWFEFSANGDVNKDSDGDGFLDDWEINGYDHNKDGVIDVPLHQLGFDPMKKDIAVAYAWMERGLNELKSHRPKQKVLDFITTSFKNSPVTNPDGTTGVKLHWRDLGGVPHDHDLNPVWQEFDLLMDPLLTDAERVVYHRGLLGHGYNGGGSSGLSRGIPASDFIETLGVFPTNPGTTYQRVGTIMHELGHNLGLRHGGVDHTGYKPNHLSVMNYLHQLDWIPRKDKPFLDYERFELSDLNESDLEESAGLTNNNSLDFRKYGTRWYVPNGTLFEIGRNANFAIDWDQSGNITNGVSLDSNGDNATSILRAGHSEWDNIVYNGGSIGGTVVEGNRQESDPTMLDELTVDMYLQMQQNRIEINATE